MKCLGHGQKVPADIHIDLRQKEAGKLLPTDIVFQTGLWSSVKSRLGWKPLAFDFACAGQDGDVLVLTKALLPGISTAYVPQGPEFCPDPEQYGLFLEALSGAIKQHVDPTVAFIRYDLPWESPYVDHTVCGGANRPAFQRPEARLQELRMNFGTKRWNLRKAKANLTFTDRLVLELWGDEEKILSAMKPKTRYNIHLAQRKGVRVFPASPFWLPVFYELYRQTAKRNRFPLCGYQHFTALFPAACPAPDSPEVLFLLAEQAGDILAGAIIVISHRTATYLFGASSGEKRNLMAPYALHWAAIRLARANGCRHYDLGAVSPASDPDHPFFGLYRFKTGFGGRIVHQSGTWDYPLDEEGYTIFRNSEALERILCTS
jgi:lipid II:glycine glycyltransferase (peptidoglycan interpeptide bridge formation enzyme)